MARAAEEPLAVEKGPYVRGLVGAEVTKEGPMETVILEKTIIKLGAAVAQ